MTDWFSRISPGVRFALAFFLTLYGAAMSRADGQSLKSAEMVFNTDPAVHALCGETVALLGESPTHGFGNSLEYKVQVARRLINECHYSALFVESGLYDYVHIERSLRSGQGVSDSMISAAIGGLWANREVQDFVPFLTRKVKTGSLTLGGLDDQIGRGSYASREMASDLVQPLQGDEQSRCLAVLKRHLLWQYTEDAPYSSLDKEKIVGCLNEIQTALSSARRSTTTESDTGAMVASLKRNLDRDFTENDFTKKDQQLKWINDRERSMYLNFIWLRRQLPSDSKVIVWAATVHTAKDLSRVPGMEGRVSLGSYIHSELKKAVFSFGISAYSGTFAFTNQPVRKLSDASPSSLEAQAIVRSGDDIVYLSRKQLRSFNAVPARLLGTDFITAEWSEVFDGVLVFREERLPTWITASGK